MKAKLSENLKESVSAGLTVVDARDAIASKMCQCATVAEFSLTSAPCGPFLQHPPFDPKHMGRKRFV